MVIPVNYILNVFLSKSIDPIYRQHDKTYNAGCPICREGKSLGSKKRLFFYPETKSFYCYNCNRSWNALTWIKTVTGLSFSDIAEEIANGDFSKEIDIDFKDFNNLVIKKPSLPSLPYDSINLFDKSQKEFYRNEKYINLALAYIKHRRLDVAVNRSKKLFISLTDKIHKNRLCIPFLDRNGKILFYQTRALEDDGTAKYLGKYNSDKTLFNLENIDSDFPYIFIFEGPIDSMFVKNGVSAAGLVLTGIQKTQLKEFPLHKRIWVLDNPLMDETAREKTIELMEEGENVFVWPKNYYKDFNQWAVEEGLDEINIVKLLQTR